MRNENFGRFRRRDNTDRRMNDTLWSKRSTVAVSSSSSSPSSSLSLSNDTENTQKHIFRFKNKFMVIFVVILKWVPYKFTTLCVCNVSLRAAESLINCLALTWVCMCQNNQIKIRAYSINYKMRASERRSRRQSIWCHSRRVEIPIEIHKIMKENGIFHLFKWQNEVKKKKKHV